MRQNEYASWLVRKFLGSFKQVIAIYAGQMGAEDVFVTIIVLLSTGTQGYQTNALKWVVVPFFFFNFINFIFFLRYFHF